MIKYILMIVCLSLAFESFAEEESTDSATDENEHVELSAGEVQDLVNNICNQMILYNDSGAGEPWEAFEANILDHLGITKQTSTYRKQVTMFWNKYHQHMICSDKIIGYNSPQHLLKRIVEMNVIISFFFDYFLRDPNMQINAVEVVDGKKQTLLD